MVILRIFIIMSFGLLQTVCSVSRLDYARTQTEFQQKPKFKKDTAWLTINSSVGFDISLYSLNDECWKCPYIFIKEFPSGANITITVNTTFGTSLVLKRLLVALNVEEEFCRLDDKFRESGDYWIFVDQQTYTDGNCELLITNDPLPAEMPILYVGLALVVLWIVINVGLYLYR